LIQKIKNNVYNVMLMQ